VTTGSLPLAVHFGQNLSSTTARTIVSAIIKLLYTLHIGHTRHVCVVCGYLSYMIPEDLMSKLVEGILTLNDAFEVDGCEGGKWV